MEKIYAYTSLTAPVRPPVMSKGAACRDHFSQVEGSRFASRQQARRWGSWHGYTSPHSLLRTKCALRKNSWVCDRS